MRSFLPSPATVYVIMSILLYIVLLCVDMCPCDGSLPSQMAKKLEIYLQVSQKMDPKELVKLVEILNPSNKAGRITVIVRMGAENMRVKLPHLIRAVRSAGQIVTWVCDPMHGNTIKAPNGYKTRAFDAILVSTFSNKFL